MSNDLKDVEQVVRKVMREEIGRSGAISNQTTTCSSGTATPNIYVQTQSLIRSTAERLGSPMPGQRDATPQRRSFPGHPYRYAAARKSKTKMPKGKMMNIVLLPPIMDDEEDGYKADSDQELLSGYIEIFPDYTETTVRKHLTNLFKLTYPLINSNDFEFVKRVKNKVFKPSTTGDFEWNYEAVKVLAGQGKLCCRLIVEPKVLINQLDDDDDDDDDKTFSRPVFRQRSIQPYFVSPTPPSESVSRQQASTPPAPTPSNSSTAGTLPIPQAATCATSTLSIAPSTSTVASSTSTVASSVASSLAEQMLTECDHSYANAVTIDLTIEEDENNVHESLIYRSKLKNDMIDEFMDESFLKGKVNFGIMGYNGKLEPGQGVGVQREVVSSFFDEFYSSCCVGAAELVPMIRHDMSKLHWESIARIICFGIKLGYFPVRLSPAFIKSCLFGEDCVLNDELIESFLDYIPDDDKEIISKNLSHFEEDKEELLEVLSSYKCYKNPTKDCLKEIVVEIAHQELVQKPKYVANCWFNVFKPVRFPVDLSSPMKLKAVYKQKIPSGRKVVQLLKSTPSDLQQTECFEHLKRYIRNLTLADLKKLLKLMTGSDLILVDEIEVIFLDMPNSFTRRPIFHTCGPLLKLPQNYSQYNELAEEFNNVLDAPKSSLSFDSV